MIPMLGIPNGRLCVRSIGKVEEKLLKTLTDPKKRELILEQITQTGKGYGFLKDFDAATNPKQKQAAFDMALRYFRIG